MSRIPSRRALLLDLAAGIGLGGPALMVLYSFDRRPAWMSTSVVLLLAAAVVVWVLWRRSGQRSHAAAVVFAVIATATMTLGDGSLYYGIIWTACLMLGIAFSSALVPWAYAAALIVLVVVLHLSAGSPVELLVTEAIAAAFFGGIAAAVSAILRDSLRVGESLREALVRLDAANAELRRRLGADRDLVLARERERTARELHDGLGHRLTAIGLSLDYAARVDDPDAAREELRRARDLVGESLAAMRRLVRAMHPVELSALGDAEAFRAVAEAFRGTGIDIRVSIEGDDAALSHERSLLLLRFVQEGLTNVVRHSNATSAELRVVVGGADAAGGVVAAIEDRGGRAAVVSPAVPVATEPSATEPSSTVSPSAAPSATEPSAVASVSTASPSVTEGFGLRSLRSRAEALGGRLEASPTPGGFRLALTLPPDDAARIRPVPDAVPQDAA